MFLHFFKDWEKKKKKYRRRLIVKSMFVGFGVVMVWRGMWNFMDAVLFPNQPVISSLVSLIVGIGILLYSHKLVDELM